MPEPDEVPQVAATPAVLLLIVGIVTGAVCFGLPAGLFGGWVLW